MAVDDSASLRQMVSVVLRGGGYQVIESVDGLDALSKLKGQELHLFLTDINMPKMDGFEFTREVRAMPAIQVRPHRSVNHRVDSGKETARQGRGRDGLDRQTFQPRSASGGGEEGNPLMAG